MPAGNRLASWLAGTIATRNTRNAAIPAATYAPRRAIPSAAADHEGRVDEARLAGRGNARGLRLDAPLFLQAGEEQRNRVERGVREAGAQRAVRGRLDARQLVREPALARHAVDGNRERFAGACAGHRLDARRRRLDEGEVLAAPRDAVLGDLDR